MTDIQTAKNNLAGHTICLCKGGECLYSDRRGIAPMMGFIESGVDLSGYSVADKVVGKAAALLFIKCGIISVYAETLSEYAKKALEERGIAVEYKTLTERIINRDGTDICPMEKTVLNCGDAEEAYALLKNKLKELQK
ncbi:MAG: DUF1893 domain-containing protein [Clostridiales bacterium]|nr:DUF1893 domain-containing protein [Clostridiales bacterium]